MRVVRKRLTFMGWCLCFCVGVGLGSGGRSSRGIPFSISSPSSPSSRRCCMHTNTRHARASSQSSMHGSRDSWPGGCRSSFSFSEHFIFSLFSIEYVSFSKSHKYGKVSVDVYLENLTTYNNRLVKRIRYDPPPPPPPRQHNDLAAMWERNIYCFSI